MRLSNNILVSILVLLIGFCLGYAYFRFMIVRDYMVAYEGECDPAAQSCFVGCDDSACTSEYYYAKVQKYAVHLQAECGPDITNCDAASVCLPEDEGKCLITYCDSELDGVTCTETAAQSTP
ncbi:MAG: hypothetical protein PHV99_02175 [Candidatus Pacebacteria bacterium]|nr:hypothetical protein [Candidatus Paceibacterota bacterium]